MVIFNGKFPELIEWIIFYRICFVMSTYGKPAFPDNFQTIRIKSYNFYQSCLSIIKIENEVLFLFNSVTKRL